MSRSQPKNDWDSFEELHVIVEQLDLCRTLLRSRSHSKARAAVILLDHVADAMMYRICDEDFGMQAFAEMVIPPALPAKKRVSVLFSFNEKVFYLSRKKRLIVEDDANVLTIGYRIRNFAYHRNYHNPATIAMVGRILYRTVCAILPSLFNQGGQSYSDCTNKQAWAARYGVKPSSSNFEDSSKRIAESLAQQVPISIDGAIEVLKADVFNRYHNGANTRGLVRYKK